MELWVVGEVIKEGEDQQRWELVGIFDTRDKAVSACRDWTYFVWQTELNSIAPEESVEMPGSYFPFAPGFKK